MVHPLAQPLEEAIRHEQVAVVFQPQFGADDNRLIGAEGLLRWSQPQAGVIGGDRLFAIAGQAGLAERLSAYVRDRALAAAAQWPESVRLSLNATAMDLRREDFASGLAEVMQAGSFDPARLTLEITEQSLVEDLEGAAHQLCQLVELGVRIALDDFGAGFCNFRYLKVLPLHYLKLDRSMIEGLDRDPRDLAVLRGIIAMAHALDLEVIAEGIETAAQRDAVRREGCASWQGFLGGRPVEAADFAQQAGA